MSSWMQFFTDPVASSRQTQTFATPCFRSSSGRAWVVDGWHEQRLGTLAIERADEVVFLDPPLLLVLWRVLRRTVPEIVLRKELWNGNRQTLRGAFGGRKSLLGYTLRRHPDLRKRVPVTLADPKLTGIRCVRLRTRRDVRRWLADVATRH
jgi:hypothetical protein